MTKQSVDAAERSVRAAMLIVAEIARLIEHKREVPSGELYAQLMCVGIQLSDYQLIIEKLKEARLIKVSNHLITWIGPAEEWKPKTFEDGRMR